jgi:hypothetical protein
VVEEEALMVLILTEVARDGGILSKLATSCCRNLKTAGMGATLINGMCNRSNHSLN